jgi:hypothetical protein
MSQILFPTSKEFFLDKAPKGNVMCCTQKGIMFVLFHADSARCTYCEEIIPEFRKLPYSMAGIKFAMVNINKNKELVDMSSKTIAPITYVPYMILYVEGRPFTRYDGERKLQDILGFLNTVLNGLKNKRDFFENKNFKLESDVPVYTTGSQMNVICDTEKGVCYLSSKDAYPGMKS